MRVTFLSYRSLEHLNLVNSCYRGALEGQSWWAFTSARLWHQDMVLSSERKLSPRVNDGNPGLRRMVHVSPPVDHQFLASPLAREKQGHGQKKDTAAWFGPLTDLTLDHPGRDPQRFQGLLPSHIHACAHPATDLTGQHSHGHSREAKAAQQSLRPPHVALQPSAAGFLPPSPRAGPGLRARWKWPADEPRSRPSHSHSAQCGSRDFRPCRTSPDLSKEANADRGGKKGPVSWLQIPYELGHPTWGQGQQGKEATKQSLVLQLSSAHKSWTLALLAFSDRCCKRRENIS